MNSTDNSVTNTPVARPIRFHDNLVSASVDTLYEICNYKKFADQAIEQKLRSNKKWGAKDRQFIAETVYEVVRWKRLYAYLIDADYQRLSTQNIRDLVATHYVYTEQYDREHHESLPLFSNLPIKNIHQNLAALNKSDSDEHTYIRESIPSWLGDILKAEVGENWADELYELNKSARLILRCNTLLNSIDELQATLARENIITETIEGYPDALVIPKRRNIFRSNAFKEGLFEVQDANSQLVAEMLDLEPGQRVIDACAGAGGKSLHIATKLNNKGSVIAMDIHDYKLEELKRRAKRNQAFNITTKLIDSQKVIKRLKGSADRLLIDAPCSGLGVLKRNPDAKWKLDHAFIEEVKQTQSEILEKYSAMLKVEGIMVYATCSILDSENKQQVAKFLENNPSYTLLEERVLLPSQTNYDGFYIAKIQKTA